MHDWSLPSASVLSDTRILVSGLARSSVAGHVLGLLNGSWRFVQAVSAIPVAALQRCSHTLPVAQDVLIQNSDRHAGHFLYAEHWADGSYVPQPSPQVGGGAAGGRVMETVAMGWDKLGVNV